MREHETQLVLVAAQVKGLERDLYDARQAQRRVVLDALDAGMTEAGVARLTGLSRTTVRAWRQTADALDT